MKLEAAISGIGRTAYSRAAEGSILDLATEAALQAIADAGLSVADIDGVGCFHENDSVDADSVAAALGCGPLGWAQDQLGGGSSSAATVGQAALAVSGGWANHVVVYRAMKGASGFRIGSLGVVEPAGAAQFTIPYGYATAVQWYGMACRRHMHVFGTPPEALAAIAVNQRANANLNPHAVMYGKPLSEEEYFASPFIADPFRLLDCCQETDGAVAIVVSRAEAGSSSTSRTIRVLAASYGSGSFANPPYEKYEDLTVMFPRWLAQRVFEQADMTPADIDVACIYDAFTFTVLCQLEDFGFCAKGEGADLILSGHTKLGGSLPVNPHGGLLSEGYIHGLNGVYEAVAQLRGECGAHQVPGAESALVSAFGYSRGSALVLHRE